MKLQQPPQWMLDLSRGLEHCIHVCTREPPWLNLVETPGTLFLYPLGTTETYIVYYLQVVTKTARLPDVCEFVMSKAKFEHRAETNAAIFRDTITQRNPGKKREEVRGGGGPQDRAADPRKEQGGDERSGGVLVFNTKYNTKGRPGAACALDVGRGGGSSVPPRRFDLTHLLDCPE